MSEVPLSRLSAINREPRVAAAVRCSGLGGRIPNAHGSRPRPGAIIVLLGGTAEAGGGAPGPAESAWPSRAAQGAASPAAAGTGSALLTPI